MTALMDRVRDALRPGDERDVWIGPAPSDAELEERLGGDPEARGLLLEWSMQHLVERWGVQSVLFRDPTFTLDLDRAADVCRWRRSAPRST